MRVRHPQDGKNPPQVIDEVELLGSASLGRRYRLSDFNNLHQTIFSSVNRFTQRRSIQV